MVGLIYLYLFLLPLTLSLLFVPFARRLASRFNLLDRPNGRKAHNDSRPLLGGLAIYLAFILTLGIQLGGFYLFKDTAFFANTFPLLVRQADLLANVLPQMLAILGGATLMLVLGLLDDCRREGISYKIKFAVQFLAAGLLVLVGIQTTFMPTHFLNILVTVLWIVGITNAFNLLDNMDGLSAGVALIATLLLIVITGIQSQFFSAMILCILAGAVLGFLRYNFHPARIFMGDAGSLFIGFVLASLTITTSYVVPQSASLLPVLIPVLVLSIPIFDTLSVVLIRLREKRPVFLGDRRHFSHRLVKVGMTPRGAVIFIYLIAATIGVAAAFLPYLPVWAQILALVQAVLVYLMIAIIMEVRKNHNEEPTEDTQTFTHKLTWRLQ